MLIAILTYFFFSCCCSFLLDFLVRSNGDDFTGVQRRLLFLFAPFLILIILFQLLQEACRDF